MHYHSETSPGARLVGIGFVVAMHIAIAWALVSGLATTAIEVIKAPLQVDTLIEKEQQKDTPPPPPPAALKPPPVFVPPPDINIQTPTTANNAIVGVSSAHSNPRIAMPQAEYPDVARRLKAEGKIMLSADFDERGRMSNVQFVSADNMNVNDPAVIEAFKKEALLAVRDARVKPAMNGGVAVAQQGYKFVVTFTCKDRATGENNCN